MVLPLEFSRARVLIAVSYFLDLNTFAEHSIASKVFVPLDRDQNAVSCNFW